MSGARRSLPFPLLVLIGLLLVITLLVVVFQPDRRLPMLSPGMSSEPTFVVQIIRPRAGLPLGGLLPPGLFGLDERLGFDSGSAGARVGVVSSRRVELDADGWQLVLALDDAGRVVPDQTEVVFELVFEEQPRQVRCRPADPAVGTVVLTTLPDGDHAGQFDLELARCADAVTGESLGWPPQPFVLAGSFDGLGTAGVLDER